MTADRQDAPANDRLPPVTVAEAAAALGTTPDAIRSRLRRGKLSGRRGNDGEWRVELPSEPGAAPLSSDRLRDKLDRTEAELDRMRTEHAAALLQLATVTRQLEDSQATAAQLCADLARRDGEAVGTAAMIVELRESLAWHRRPWWRRLLDR
jgi:hypothetical protein